MRQPLTKSIDIRRSGDRIILGLTKGGETYVWVYSGSREQVHRSMARQASDVGLSLNWYDVARLSQAMQKGPQPYAV